MYIGQFIYVGKNVVFIIGNVFFFVFVFEGIVVFNVEEKVGDCGVFGCIFGNYIIVVGYNFDEGKICIKFFFGVKKVVSFSVCGMIGIVVGGGRIDKFFFKVFCVKYKFVVKCNRWFKICGVVMNFVDYFYGGVSVILIIYMVCIVELIYLYRVIISILVRCLLFLDMLFRVKRWVLLLFVEWVCCVVFRR